MLALIRFTSAGLMFSTARMASSTDTVPAGPPNFDTGVPLSLPAGAYDDFAVVTSTLTFFYATFDNVSITTSVPEPTTLGLLAIGGVSLLGRRRRA